MPVYDALYDGGVEHLLCRHEQGAAMAALGYACATGKVGVCIATSGPGATNLITGLADVLESLPEIMAEAFAIASSARPGLLLVDIPKDIQLATSEIAPQFTPVDDSQPNFPEQAIEQARAMMAAVWVWRRRCLLCVRSLLRRAFPRRYAERIGCR
uniref:TPP_enzyme_N domain-containing protein n=1 Tax=Rhodnius prolixus TaxID=13249 RepID=T1I8H3_RHOPR